MRPSPITDAPLASGAVMLAVALLVFVAALFAVGVGALALDAGLAGWLVLPAMGVGIVAGVAARAASDPATATATATAARLGARLALALGAILALALALGASVYDVSWDGQVYHQQAVLALAEGWNPLRDAPLSLSVRPDNLWIDHYPKAAWIAQAILYRATGSLEASKGLQLLPLVAAALLVYAIARARGLGIPAATLASALLAANPVGLAQSCSFYCDGLAASLMTALLALFLCGWWRRPAPGQLAAHAAVLVVLINLKFTGLVYAAGLCGGLGIWLWRRQPDRLRGFVVVTGAAIGVATLGLGFDPYVTNLLRKGHPFYPLMGSGAVDIITNQLTPAFHAHGRLTRLLISLFARADAHNVTPVLKWPFTVLAGELPELAYADLRIGGFGPLFAASGLLATAFLLARRRLGIHVPRLAWALGTLIVAVSFSNPALWWARYVPQLWLLPAGALALALASPRLSRLGHAGAWLLGGLLVANVALVGASAAAAELRATRAVRDQLDRLQQAGASVAVRWQGFDAVRARLREHAIAFREVAVLPCASPEALRASLAHVCPAATATTATTATREGLGR